MLLKSRDQRGERDSKGRLSPGTNAPSPQFMKTGPSRCNEHNATIQYLGTGVSQQPEQRIHAGTHRANMDT